MSWLPKKKVIVPVDFSDNSVAALQTALEIAAEPAAVHVVHVLTPLDGLSPGAIFDTVDDAKRQASTGTYFAEFLSKNGIAGVKAVVRFGDPGLVIADYAAEQSADLIVVPSHGYHGVKRFVLGSVAERVIRHAHCPVLVLRRADGE